MNRGVPVVALCRAVLTNEAEQMSVVYEEFLLPSSRRRVARSRRMPCNVW
jgi:hypothetical protein